MPRKGFGRRGFFALAASALTSACGTRGRAVSDNASAAGRAKAEALPKDSLVVNELQLDYSIILGTGTTTSPVSEQFGFHNGDRFRLRFRPGFEAHVYLLNRGARQKGYSFLFPRDEVSNDNPVPAHGVIEVPGSDRNWLQMDRVSGTEQIVLIASPSPLVEFNVPAKLIDRDEFEERIGRVERDYRPTSSRRVENGGWISLFASRGPKTALVVRLPLDHRS